MRSMVLSKLVRAELEADVRDAGVPRAYIDAGAQASAMAKEWGLQ